MQKRKTVVVKEQWCNPIQCDFF